MVRSKLISMASLLLLVSSILAQAQYSESLDVKTRRIAVFKDGYCMFVKQLAGRVDRSGVAHIEDVPGSMVLGSFWIVPEGATLKHVVAKKRIIPRQAGQQIEKSLALQFSSEMAGKEIAATLFYFAPGMRWIPTYRIALGANEAAGLMMQAEILNEAEDLSDAEIDLVVGVPNFRFKDVVSPMSLEAALRDTLRQAAPQLMSQTMSNALMTQRLGDIGDQSSDPSTPAATGAPSLPPELTAEQAHDLFVYNIGRFSLRSGERAAVPVMSANIPFRHIYTWDLHLERSHTEAAPSVGPSASPVKLLKNEVWHQIEMTNTADVPWTTGAALIMDGHLPIAQELLTYTSIGGTVRIPLTVAVDIRGTFSEEEVERELDAIRFDGHDYIRVSKKGLLRVTNYRQESAALKVRCDLGGNATGASDEGAISVSDFEPGDWSGVRAGGSLNGHSTIAWDIAVQPNETRELTCEYFYFIR